VRIIHSVVELVLWLFLARRSRINTSICVQYYKAIFKCAL
jgi:hypothetical protein